MTACKNAELAFIHHKSVYEIYFSNLLCVLAARVLIKALCSHYPSQSDARRHSSSFSQDTVLITEVTTGASYVTGWGSAGFKNITHICPSYENTEGQTVIEKPEFWMCGLNSESDITLFRCAKSSTTALYYSRCIVNQNAFHFQLKLYSLL